MSQVLNYSVEATHPKKRWRWILFIQALQAFLVAAPVLVLTGDFWMLLLAMAAIAVVSAAQLALLAPVLEPRIDGAARRSWTTWLSASIAGLLAGMLACGLVIMAGDILWFCDILPSTSSGSSLSDGGAWSVAGVGLFAFLVSWAIMTPLLVLFMRGRSPEKGLFQIAATLFLGTIVEALSAIGIMVMINRRSECVCATFSGLTLACTFGLGFVVFGPAVLLLVLWRRSRYRPGGLCPACGAALGALEYPPRCPACGIGWKTAA